MNNARWKKLLILAPTIALISRSTQLTDGSKWKKLNPAALPAQSSISGVGPSNVKAAMYTVMKAKFIASNLLTISLLGTVMLTASASEPPSVSAQWKPWRQEFLGRMNASLQDMSMSTPNSTLATTVKISIANDGHMQEVSTLRKSADATFNSKVLQAIMSFDKDAISKGIFTGTIRKLSRRILVVTAHLKNGKADVDVILKPSNDDREDTDLIQH